MSQLMLIQGVMCCCVRFLNRYNSTAVNIANVCRPALSLTGCCDYIVTGCHVLLSGFKL